MISKATPGPWKTYVRKYPSGETHFWIGHGETESRGPDTVADTIRPSFSGSASSTHERLAEAEANARLIAAAPELLEAAHEALSLLRGSGFTDSTKAVILLKAAIAKAE